MNAVLVHYPRYKIPPAREPRVLGAIAHKNRCDIMNKMLKMFDATFEGTLSWSIKVSRSTRNIGQVSLNYYKLLMFIVLKRFVLNIPPPQFILVFDSIVWAFKYTLRNFADMGLSATTNRTKLLPNMLSWYICINLFGSNRHF